MVRVVNSRGLLLQGGLKKTGAKSDYLDEIKPIALLCNWIFGKVWPSPSPLQHMFCIKKLGDWQMATLCQKSSILNAPTHIILAVNV